MSLRPLRFVIAAIVGTSATLPAQSSPPAKQLVEELRLDATKEDFPNLRSFSVGPKGQIIVPIDEDQQLRFYDASGKKYATLGRKGSGPGEFQRIARIGWLGDTCWVADFNLYRITYLSSAGQLFGSEVVSPALNAATVGRGASLDSGAVFSFVPWAVLAPGTVVGPAMISEGKNPDGTVGTHSLIIATTADGTTRATIAVPPKAARASVSYQPGDGSSFGAAIPFTFYPQTQYAADGSRLAMLSTDVTAKSATYMVTSLRLRRGRGGLGATGSKETLTPQVNDTLFSRTYSTVPEAIPARVLDSAMNAIGAPTPGRGPMFPPAVADQLRERARALTPAAYAPVSGLVIGLDNTTWVLFRKTTEGTPAVALDAKGNPVASILVPKNSRLIQASLAHVWVIETDVDGLGSIVRYRLK